MKSCANCNHSIWGEPRAFNNKCQGCRRLSGWEPQVDITIQDESADHQINVDPFLPVEFIDKVTPIYEGGPVNLCLDIGEPEVTVGLPERNVAPKFSEPEEEVLELCDDVVDESPDMVDHPNHYTDGPDSGIECWDWYELAMQEAEFRGAMKNNIWKYTYRAGRKDPNKTVEDLNKAIAYLKRWIKFEEGRRTVWMKGIKHDVEKSRL